MNAPLKRTGKYKITAITPNKKGQMMVSFGREKLLLSPNAFTEMPLFVGKELTPNQHRSLVLFTKNEALLNYALTLASKGSYSVHDVREKLRLKSQDEDTIRQLLKTLKEQGMLNDVDFAEEFKEEKEAQLYGKERIVQDLKFKHGIRDEIVDKLSFKNEKEHAEKAGEFLARKYARLPLKSKKEKAALSLIRRGYAPGVAKEAVAHFSGDKIKENKSLNLLCEKTLKRYASKYNGYQLKSKAFAYLVGKGYSVDEVNRVLEEKL
jgi:regulatory protein